MCGSIADIQSATAEIRRGKTERKKKSQGKNIMQGGHNKLGITFYRLKILTHIKRDDSECAWVWSKLCVYSSLGQHHRAGHVCHSVTTQRYQRRHSLRVTSVLTVSSADSVRVTSQRACDVSVS